MVGVGIYVTPSVEAVELYCQAFGLTLGYNVRNEDGSFFHSELMDEDGAPALSVVEAKRPGEGCPVQLGMGFHSKEDLERAFTILARDGRVDMAPCTLPWSPWAAEVTDRFHVNWYLTLPQSAPGDDFDPATSDYSGDRDE